MSYVSSKRKDPHEAPVTRDDCLMEPVLRDNQSAERFLQQMKGLLVTHSCLKIKIKQVGFGLRLELCGKM